jgi:ABC-2 type transport system ATP-binding protein
VTLTPATDPAQVPDATVAVTGLSKFFGQKVAVSNVTCSFGPGVSGLLGPNGAGKTTLLRTVAGLLRPSEGTVSVLGGAPRANPDVYRNVGLVPEEDAVYGFLTGRQYVEYAAKLAKVANPSAEAARAIHEVELEDDADRAIEGFSKGMRQRIKVAAALVHDPEVLILDEPLNGTDPVQRARLIALFQRLGRSGVTVIVSSHVLQEVERMAQRVLAIVDGKLAAAGDVSAIRRAMADIPYRVLVESDQPRRLGSALLEHESVNGVELAGGSLHIETSDLFGLGTTIPGVARGLGARITAFRPEDESLESVFRYLVERR